jgi:tetratricopeptide (TPR) repeat protein
LGITYAATGDSILSAENIRKAYLLRDRVSDAEKFFISTSYEIQVLGDLEKAEKTCEVWGQTYPRDAKPATFLAGMIYPVLGKYEKAVGAARKGIALDPDFAIAYYQLSFNSQYLDRLAEGLEAVRQATARKLEIPGFLFQRYDIAFLEGDLAGMAREVALARGNSDAEDWMSDQEAFTAAYSGRLQTARRLSARASDLAQQAGRQENAAMYDVGTALWEAWFGNAAAAKRIALAALERSKARDVEYGAALALAIAGDSSRAETLANDLEKRFPDDTSSKFSYLPVLRARLALQNGLNPLTSVEFLRTAIPNELGTPSSSATGFFGALYPVYVRGELYLAAHKGAEAAAEFQKVLNHRGIVVSDPIGALARLQLGRALAMAGDPGKAKAAYQDFLTLWKDADADIPILIKARAEFAALQ